MDRLDFIGIQLRTTSSVFTSDHTITLNMSHEQPLHEATLVLKINHALFSITRYVFAAHSHCVVTNCIIR